MRRNSPAELGSLSSIPKDECRFKTRRSGETGLSDKDTASGVVVAAVLFSRLRYGQLCIVVRGQDVGCGCGWWQHDLLCVPETCPSGHAMAGQTVAMLTSITAITNATAVLIIEVDVPKWVLVGGIFNVRPKTSVSRTAASGVQYNRKHATTKPVSFLPFRLRRFGLF